MHTLTTAVEFENPRVTRARAPGWGGNVFGPRFPQRARARVPGIVSGFKYQSKLSCISGCPPQAVAPAKGKAYRFVHAAMTADNFVPQAVRNPKVACSCTGWALSLFRSLDEAEVRFRQLEATPVPNIRKRIGDSVAEGHLTPAFGAVTPANDTGHFDLYEYTGANLLPAFVVVKAL